MVDDETCFSAGDDTGAELVATCPYATQTIVDVLLASLRGKTYQAYYAEAAEIDPLAELGDGVTVEGTYSMLAAIKDDGSGYPDIEASGNDELEDEYPVKGSIEKTIDRNMATTRSLISKTANAIILRIEDTEGSISEIKVTLDGVTITDDSGTTKIKGSSIDTGTLAAQSITADKLLLTGSITWDDFSDETQSRIDSGKGDSNPSYIKRTYIDEAKLVAPDIYAGMFYATGKGAEDGAAYYLYDGCEVGTNGSVTLGTKIGYISYDTTGTGYENPERVLFTTLNGTALKLNASGNMSLEADEFIYLHTPFKLVVDVHYGDTLPSAPFFGQLFYLEVDEE